MLSCTKHLGRLYVSNRQGVQCSSDDVICGRHLDTCVMLDQLQEDAPVLRPTGHSSTWLVDEVLDQLLKL